MGLWPEFLSIWIIVSVINAQSPEWISLFNGENLDGWQKYLGVPNGESPVPMLTTDVHGRYISDLGVENDPLQVFSVVSQDGEPAIKVSGEVSGTLSSIQSFNNYHLRLQYKWGGKKWSPRKELPRRSGLLYHGFGEPGCIRMRWHHSQAFQFQQGECGDYGSIGDVEMDVPSNRLDTGGWYRYEPEGNLRTFVSNKDLTHRRCIKAANYELPPGDWNTVELICWGDSSIHIVNGRVAMRLYNSVQIKRGLRRPLASGILAFQSEGAEVFYRNINVRFISKIPEEYAELE